MDRSEQSNPQGPVLACLFACHFELLEGCLKKKFVFVDGLIGLDSVLGFAIKRKTIDEPESWDPVYGTFQTESKFPIVLKYNSGQPCQQLFKVFRYSRCFLIAVSNRTFLQDSPDDSCITRFRRRSHWIESNSFVIVARWFDGAWLDSHKSHLMFKHLRVCSMIQTILMGHRGISMMTTTTVPFHTGKEQTSPWNPSLCVWLGQIKTNRMIDSCSHKLNWTANGHGHQRRRFDSDNLCVCWGPSSGFGDNYCVNITFLPFHTRTHPVAAEAMQWKGNGHTSKHSSHIHSDFNARALVSGIPAVLGIYLSSNPNDWPIWVWGWLAGWLENTQLCAHKTRPHCQCSKQITVFTGQSIPFPILQ